MQESFDLDQSESAKIEKLSAYIEIRKLELSELKIALKKVKVHQEDIEADIKTVQIDETACRTIISCQVQTQDQVCLKAKYLSYRFSIMK